MALSVCAKEVEVIAAIAAVKINLYIGYFSMVFRAKIKRRIEIFGIKEKEFVVAWLNLIPHPDPRFATRLNFYEQSFNNRGSCDTEPAKRESSHCNKKETV